MVKVTNLQNSKRCHLAPTISYSRKQGFKNYYPIVLLPKTQFGTLK